MDKLNDLYKSVAIIVTALIFAVTIYVSVTIISNVADKYLDSTAAEQCANIARFEETRNDGDTTTVYRSPVLEIYNNCLIDRGLK